MKLFSFSFFSSSPPFFLPSFLPSSPPFSYSTPESPITKFLLILPPRPPPSFLYLRIKNLIIKLISTQFWCSFHYLAGWFVLFGGAFFFMSWGPLTTIFAIPAEMFPTRWRATGENIFYHITCMVLFLECVNFIMEQWFKLPTHTYMHVRIRTSTSKYTYT